MIGQTFTSSPTDYWLNIPGVGLGGLVPPPSSPAVHFIRWPQPHPLFWPTLTPYPLPVDRKPGSDAPPPWYRSSTGAPPRYTAPTDARSSLQPSPLSDPYGNPSPSTTPLRYVSLRYALPTSAARPLQPVARLTCTSRITNSLSLPPCPIGNG